MASFAWFRLVWKVLRQAIGQSKRRSLVVLADLVLLRDGVLFYVILSILVQSSVNLPSLSSGSTPLISIEQTNLIVNLVNLLPLLLLSRDFG
jgi:uncharacterized protein with PQ loop repeat